MPNSGLISWRNKLARWIVNNTLRFIATREYQLWIEGACEYGLRSAAQDSKEGLPSPPDWRISD